MRLDLYNFTDFVWILVVIFVTRDLGLIMGLVVFDFCDFDNDILIVLLVISMIWGRFG